MCAPVSAIHLTYHTYYFAVYYKMQAVFAPTETKSRLAEMHRKRCNALHDEHPAARMPRAFLNVTVYSELCICKSDHV